MGFRWSLKELVDEIVWRDVRIEFQLYGTNNVKAREQVEWVLLRSGVSRRNVFDNLISVLFVVGGQMIKWGELGSQESCDGWLYELLRIICILYGIWLAANGAVRVVVLLSQC